MCEFFPVSGSQSIGVQSVPDLRNGSPCGVFLEDSAHDWSRYRIDFIRAICGLFQPDRRFAEYTMIQCGIIAAAFYVFG